MTIVGGIAMALAPARLAAQAALPSPGDRWVQPELRADVIAARVTAVELAGALSMPFGTYVRGSLAAGAGMSWRGGDTGASQRIDATARFMLDPFRERRWAPYGLGGGSVRHDPWQGWRPLLVLGLGVEGPAHRGVVSAFEVSLGGGVRVGVALRRGIRERR